MVTWARAVDGTIKCKLELTFCDFVVKLYNKTNVIVDDFPWEIIELSGG
jgi:hypothetical protein